MKRRDLIKMAGAGCAAILADKLLAQDHSEAIPQNKDSMGVLVDTTACIGCRKCEWACNQVNALPNKDQKAFEDKSVFKAHRRPTDVAYTVVNSYEDERSPGTPKYIKIQCMHCAVPACASACLVGALRKTPDGPVTYDAGKCMGCRYCMVACPFQIPAYEYANALTPRVMKCNFCATRLQDGKKEICPNEALTFGRRDALLELAYSKIKQSPEKYRDHLYGHDEVGGTSWLYMAGVDFSKTELPTLSSRPAPEATEPIQHGIFKYFVPPLALYSILGISMISLKDRGEKKEDEHHGA
jgi:formate dehydrogenase iron-sulfur subunit